LFCRKVDHKAVNKVKKFLYFGVDSCCGEKTSCGNFDVIFRSTFIDEHDISVHCPRVVTCGFVLLVTVVSWHLKANRRLSMAVFVGF